MKTKMLVIFDLDGTLFRTETVDIAAFKRALAKNGFRARSEEEILDCIGLTMHEICRRFGIDEASEEEKFTSELIEIEKEEIYLSGKLYDGVEAFLKRLKAKGMALCICSNGTYGYVRCVLDRFGLYELFDEVWSQTDGVDKNMAVAGLIRRHQAEIFAVVGDRTCDIEAARSNGGVSIGMTHGFGGKEPFAADFTAGNISELESVIDTLSVHK